MLLKFSLPVSLGRSDSNNTVKEQRRQAQFGPKWMFPGVEL